MTINNLINRGMKKLFYCIFVVILLATACNYSNNQATQKQDSIIIEKKKEDSIAKHRADSIELIKATLYQVSGQVLFEQKWCGGVQRSLEDERHKTQYYKNKKLVVIKGKVNSDTCIRVKELMTDTKGEFAFEVKAGTYGIIIEDWKKVKFTRHSDDIGDKQIIACLKEKYKEPDLIVEVIDKPVNKLKYTVIGYCSGGNVCNPNGGNNRP
jgi:hypothetical protein